MRPGQWGDEQPRDFGFMEAHSPKLWPMAGEGTWITANGEVVQIKHMGTDHLINCAGMLWRIGVKARFGLQKDAKPLDYYRGKIKEILRELEKRA
jgi:hypothetical protein